MHTSDYDYDLPNNLIAQTPLKKRSDSKLLIIDKKTGKLNHEKFYNIVNFLNKNDVLVLNDTKVLPGRIIGKKEETNATIELLLLKEKYNDTWECMVKPQKRIQLGTIVNFEDKLKAECIEIIGDGISLFKFYYQGIFLEVLNNIGAMPLPPYIHQSLKEKNRYQTVYASKLGSAAAPTAGLHFTDELLLKLKNKGVKIVYITLHVGLGTFLPVKEEEITSHKMHTEYYQISEEAARELNKAKKEGNRIVCVGTTSVRTLESVYKRYNRIKAISEETDIFIYPPYQFKIVDALITNFHLPKSTLLMLVSAFSSKEIMMNAYKEAIDKKYRFFSFGDACFITRDIYKNKEYKNILKDYRFKKPYQKHKGFKIYKGTNNILVSAPHAFKHVRDNKIKKNEFNTSNIVKLLNYYSFSHIIYTNKFNQEDFNYSINNSYKEELIKYIKENNIKYFIDIHGIEKDYPYNFEIGTNNYKNVLNNKELVEDIKNILIENASKKVVIDKKYKAKEKTISYYVSKNLGIVSIQLEINKNFRKMKRQKKNFYKTIKSLIKIINYLESR